MTKKTDDVTARIAEAREALAAVNNDSLNIMDRVLAVARAVELVLAVLEAK